MKSKSAERLFRLLCQSGSGNCAVYARDWLTRLLNHQYDASEWDCITIAFTTANIHQIGSKFVHLSARTPLRMIKNDFSVYSLSKRQRQCQNKLFNLCRDSVDNGPCSVRRSSRKTPENVEPVSACHQIQSASGSRRSGLFPRATRKVSSRFEYVYKLFMSRGGFILDSTTHYSRLFNLAPGDFQRFQF